ncbi:L-asparaginase precursor [Xylariaceae sp. AK1471]|nr:L-asparaginase precursor [Xylariaceae sp. AK1471]
MAPTAALKVKPRLIIHGGAGNIQRETMDAKQYEQYRRSLISIVTSTDAYMRTPKSPSDKKPRLSGLGLEYPSALDVATYAVVKLENDPLFNSGHGAVFTRDGINELEASVMVSRGFAKRGVGMTGLRRVKNPILLAKAMLEHGEGDLVGNTDLGWSGPRSEAGDAELDVPSAQGHTLIHGKTAETLARKYGLETVDPSYFFTQKRWDEHVRGLEKEKQGKGAATWSIEEYMAQGTCGAVALDENGVVCAATSTGGMTNKLTGRIGDTPVVGAGFWAEEWSEKGDPSANKAQPATDPWKNLIEYMGMSGPIVELSSAFRSFLSDCLPTPFTYSPIAPPRACRPNQPRDTSVEVLRSTAVSGTGNGDSFLRVAAARSVASIARWTGLPSSEALNRIAGRGGELEKSAGSRWGKTGEGEGGMIGIECVIARDKSGAVLYTRSEILQDHNCAGMFRAWITDDGLPEMKIWQEEDGKSSGIGLVSLVDEK